MSRVIGYRVHDPSLPMMNREQAENLAKAYNEDGNNFIVAELRELPTPCVWTYLDDSGAALFNTRCGEPEVPCVELACPPSTFKFCPYCGAPVEVKDA